jgi:GMP synthase (glutamine-hydrolysing)
MLVYVDLEHERLQQKPEQWEQSLARRLKIKYRLEDISGEPCLIVRYNRVTPELLRDLKVRVVMVSGCATEFEHYSEESLAGLRTIFQEAAWPMLCFCGGMQLLADTYGAKIGPLRPLAPDEADPYQGAYQPGIKQEQGFMPVRVEAGHPIFDGLGSLPTFFQAHYWEVKEVPAAFRALAATDLCSIQAIAHRDLPIIATQFHPEQYDEAHGDGRKLLENFFRIVGNMG